MAISKTPGGTYLSADGVTLHDANGNVINLPSAVPDLQKSETVSFVFTNELVDEEVLPKSMVLPDLPTPGVEGQDEQVRKRSKKSA